MRALANITPDRMNMIIEALLRNATSFLINNCPQKPATTDTDMRYKAAKEHDLCY